MDSDIIETGGAEMTISINQYRAGDEVSITYKTAATYAGIAEEPEWTTYVPPSFTSLGFVQIRLVVPA